MKLVRKFALSLVIFGIFRNLVTKTASATTGTETKELKYPLDRIVGGIESKPGRAPYMVALMSVRFRGGGILVNRYYALTTAACVPDDNFYILAGVFDISSGEYDQKIPVDRVIRHTKDDIALIRLALPVFFNDIVKPAVLPPRGYMHSGNVTVFGWGTTSRSYTTLNEAELDIVDYQTCELIFGGPVKSPLNERNMCTGPLSGGIAPCTGDAGSPIVQANRDNEVEIVGLVSWGFIPCGGAGNPQVHVRVSGFIDWIVANLH